MKCTYNFQATVTPKYRLCKDKYQFLQKALSTLSTQRGPSCLLRPIQGYNNVEQSMENSIGPIHYFSECFRSNDKL